MEEIGEFLIYSFSLEMQHAQSTLSALCCGSDMLLKHAHTYIPTQSRVQSYIFTLRGISN